MTLGQRVAQKRKELGLSQEGLGEQLGVSRQAIYKWESDASLPEIDKLITLSRIFSVPVGWLLGVEEFAPERTSQDQERLVEEVLSRYQPTPRKSVWDKWSVRVLFAMCGIMLALLVGTNHKMKEMDRRYANLTSSIEKVSYSVDLQINSIASRVESILKSQNTLTAEWSAELASTDLTANTATFDVQVVPKTYVEGMSAFFVANSGKDVMEAPIEVGADHSFTGQITCPLTDQIDLSVVFVTDGRRETQWLNDFYNLYTDTFPDLYLETMLWSGEYDNVLPANDGTYPPTTVINPDTGDQNLTGMDIRVGLFRDRKLVCWYEKGTYKVLSRGTEQEETGWYRRQEVVLEPGCEYHEAAVYFDEYGRQRIYSGEGMVWKEGRWGYAAPYADNLEDWEF